MIFEESKQFALELNLLLIVKKREITDVRTQIEQRKTRQIVVKNFSIYCCIASKKTHAIDVNHIE